MQQSHGISYAEYEGSLQKRIEVEMARERDHHRCAQIKAEQDFKTANHQ